MGIAASQKPIAERQFVLQATPEQIWDLLGGVIFNCLPLESIDLQSETSFKAILRFKMAFISLPFELTGKLLNTSPPHLLDCIIGMQLWGLIRQTMKVTFTLKSVDSDRTEVVCRASNEKESLFRWLLVRMQRNMAETTMESMKTRLEQLV